MSNGIYLRADFTDKDWAAHLELLRAGIGLNYHPDYQNGRVIDGVSFSKVALALADLCCWRQITRY